MELLSVATRAHLEASAQAEIRSISSEADPRLSGEAWLDFARRQEAAGRIATAAEKPREQVLREVGDYVAQLLVALA